jgi:phage gpG-like protein
LIVARVTGGDTVPKALRDAALGVDSAVERAVLRLALKMTGLVKTKLSGEVLKVRTGRLRRSIHYTIAKGDNRTEATIGTNVSYGKTHELGLTLPPHIVEARRAKALAFGVGGRMVFAKRVHIPAVKMPQRSFLESSLRQMTPEIRDTLLAEVGGEMRRIITRGAQ